MTTNLPTEIKASQVQAVMVELSRAIGHTHEKVANLRDMLCPVLRHDPATTGLRAKKEAPSNVAPLVEELTGLLVSIEDVEAVLDDCLSRVEL